MREEMGALITDMVGNTPGEAAFTVIAVCIGIFVLAVVRDFIRILIWS